jgi:type II secretory pathway pseudopilin PulG
MCAIGKWGNIVLKRYKAKRQTQGGFTLVEAAIIITVLGLVLAPFFAYLASDYKKRQAFEGEAMNETLTAALAVYVAENGSYPCPADPALRPDDPYFGVGECGGVTGPISGVLIGSVPTKTLRLPASAAANIYGWKYFYVVGDDYVVDLGGPPVITVHVDVDGDGVVGDDIVDTNGDDVVDDPDLLVPFVIVNPGKDGKGSSQLDGGNAVPYPCSSSGAGDFENCDFTPGAAVGGVALFHDKQVGRAIDINLPNHFDDTLIYTLAREETTFWEVDDMMRQDGRVNISTRADGKVGIGTADPQDGTKLHILDGNLNIQGSGLDNRLTVNKDVRADRTITIETGNLRKIDSVVHGGGSDEGVDAVGAGGAFYYP